MPPKKKPAKKAAKKVAKKRAQKPSKARTAKKGTRTPKKPRKSPQRVVRPAEAIPAPDPDLLAEGSVSLVGPGRIRWSCRKIENGVGLVFQPAGVRLDTRRISLTLAFKHPPTGATSDSYQPKVEDRLVNLQFQTFPGWEKGFSLEVHGVNEAPEVS